MSNQTEFDWDAYARSYDSLLHLNPYRSMLEQVSISSASLQPGPRLDASCGTGNFHIIDKTLNPNPQPLIGIDGSTAMLRRAQEKCSDLHTSSFLLADLNQKLPFADECFTQVISVNTIYALENPAYTLGEFRRVLTPGGTLLLVTPQDGFENGLILKDHARSNKPDEYWLDAHSSPLREESLIREVISDEQVVKEMLFIAFYNRLIAQSQKFHFFDKTSLEKILRQTGFKIQSLAMTYSGQDFFVTATTLEE